MKIESLTKYQCRLVDVIPGDYFSFIEENTFYPGIYKKDDKGIIYQCQTRGKSIKIGLIAGDTVVEVYL